MPPNITLQYLTEYQGQSLERLTLGRAKAKDTIAVEKLKQDHITRACALIARLADVDLALIEELDAADMTMLIQKVEDFLGISSLKAEASKS